MPRKRKQPPSGRPHPIINELEIIARIQGRTLKELAAIDGISRQSWHGYATGRHSPLFDTLALRANTLECDLIVKQRPRKPSE